MGHAGARLRQDAQLVVVEVDAVGIPDVRPGPAQRLHVGYGAETEFLQRKLLLVPGLGYVGVKAHTQGPGQLGGFPEQVAAHRKGRTRGQGHLAHGKRRRVMPYPDQPFGIGHDLVDGLHHRIGGKAPILLREIHGAARGHEAHPDLSRGPELSGDEIACSAGKDIMMVETGGASGFQELAQAREGGVGDHLLVEPLPDLVQGDQPGKQLHLLHLRQVAGEDLVEVVMGVDEAGVDHHGGGVDDLVRSVVVTAD